ncbi:MAG: hypothetical protein JRJ24_20060 [Deltaproteobacteria bacterium]|nr:hypothetical protein [Deltaproteobacteria bacterium]
MRNAVAVTIRVRTAVVLRGTGVVRALVIDVQDTVTVVVRIGTAILVLEPVHVFGVVRTLVVDIENAIPVVIQIGASVLVLEAVEVFCLGWALVELVGNPVPVSVRLLFVCGHRVSQHAECAPIRSAVSVSDPSAAAHTEGESKVRKPLETAEHLHGRLVLGPETHGAVRCGSSEGLGRDHELVIAQHD